MKWLALSGLMNRKQLFSSYKHHDTVKFLEGVAASRAVIFVFVLNMGWKSQRPANYA